MTFFTASILLQEDVEIDKSIAIYEQVLELTENKPAIVVFCNYVEALRKSAQHQKAHEVGQYVMNNYKFNRGDDSVDSLFINLGLIENKLGNFDLMETYFRSAIDVNPKNKQAWKLLVEMYVRMQNYVEAEKVARFALTYVTNDAPLYYFLGVSLHFQKQVDEALVQYKIAEALDPEYLAVKSNIAAAYQGLGNAYEAISYYERIIPLMPDDAGLMNNYGALLGTMHRKEEEVYWLTRALEVDPYLEQALINLAGFYQDEGLLDDARHYLKRVHGLVAAPGLVELREALMMSPLCISFEQMTFERKRMRENMLKLLSNEIKRPEKLVSLDTSMDRIQFYIPYHALNDRHLQESIGKVYPYFTFDVNMVMPVLEKSTTQRLLRYEDKSRLQISNLFVSKKRIGFMSKFFGIFEPHGMLLDGIMKYLPRNQFVVICMAIARTDGKPIAPTIFESCDEVHEISLIFQHAMDRIMRLNLDVLLFADLVSEPMNHFLSFSKLAPIQVRHLGPLQFL